MREKKCKTLFLSSIVCFLLMSSSFLIMPIGNNLESNVRLFDVFAGCLFWFSLIAGIVLQVIIAVKYRTDANKDSTVKKCCGVISFFENKNAAIFDILTIISLIVFVAMIIFTSATSYFCYVLIAIFAFSFSMHCILNGKIYNNLFFKNNK